MALERSTLFWVVTATIGLVALPVKPAAAADRPGSNGIMVGRARLHPSADIESHWVNNPARKTEDGHYDLMTAARTGFGLLRPSDLLELNARGSAEYRHYWGIDDPITRKLSTPLGQLRADANLNPGGDFNLKVRDSLTRSANPANQAEHRRMLHWMNTAEATVRIKPGGGALVLEAGYSYFADYYDDTEDNIGSPKMLDNRRHQPEGRLMWQFLPKTAVFLEAAGNLARYPYADDDLDARQPGEPAGNIAANILQTTVGLRGLVTKRLSVLFKTGYGNSFVDDDAGDFSAPVGTLDVAYEISSAARASFTLKYGVMPTSFFRYFAQLQGSGGFTIRLLDRLTVAASLSVQRMGFGRNPKQEWTELNPPTDPNTGNTIDPIAQVRDRVDLDISGRLSLGYQIQDWATVGIHESLSMRRSNWLMKSADATIVDPIETNYFYNSLYFGLSARY